MRINNFYMDIFVIIGHILGISYLIFSLLIGAVILYEGFKLDLTGRDEGKEDD